MLVSKYVDGKLTWIMCNEKVGRKTFRWWLKFSSKIRQKSCKFLGNRTWLTVPCRERSLFYIFPLCFVLFSQDIGQESVDLLAFTSVAEVELLGLEKLKCELTARGLKCGGTLQERAARLFSVRGLAKEHIDPALFAKPSKGKKKWISSELISSFFLV